MSDTETDNVKIQPAGTLKKALVATDLITEANGGKVHYPIFKLGYGEDGSVTLVGNDGLPIQSIDGLDVKFTPEATHNYVRIEKTLDNISQQLGEMIFLLKSMSE